MKTILIAFALFSAAVVGCSAERKSHDVLLQHSTTSLSESDKTAIAKTFETWFPLSTDGLRFEDPNCGDVSPVTDVVDLNRDGRYEVFVRWGNTCTSGSAGRSLALFTKSDENGFKQHFGFPAAGWTVLDSSVNGWPDIQIDGPGFCHPVWTWVSDAYEFKCTLPETDGGCETRNDACRIAAASTK